MKRFSLLVAFLVVTVLFSGASLAATADLAGTWNLSVMTINGSGNPVFKIKQKGNNLSGQYSGQFGESEIEGTVSGNTFEIKFSSMGIDITYQGKVKGNKMRGTIDFGGQGNGDFTGVKEAK